MQDKPETGPKSEVKKHVESIVELTTRIDERVQGIIKQQLALDAKIDKNSDTINEIASRVKVLESQLVFTTEDKRLTHEIIEDVHTLEMRLGSLEKSSTNQEQRWKTIFGFALQLAWVILAAYLLYKMGIQAPAVP